MLNTIASAETGLQRYSSAACFPGGVAERIHAEIVAKVIEVARGEGADLAAGDAVLLLESMKMEIPVLTGTAGRLSHLAVGVGDVVQEGDLLAVIEVP